MKPKSPNNTSEQERLSLYGVTVRTSKFFKENETGIASPITNEDVGRGTWVGKMSLVNLNPDPVPEMLRRFTRRLLKNG